MNEKSTKNIPVVILCGGMGMRIRDVAENIPKPMIHIGNYPILWHIMKTYSHFGFNDFILCLGYKGEVIKQYFMNYYAMINDVAINLSKPNGFTYMGSQIKETWRVILADTGIDTMTGGRVSRVRQYLAKAENFMLTYGDGVADIDIAKLLEFHLAHGKLATVTGVHPISRFGEMDVDEHGKVKAFAEKPQVSEGRINGGFFVIRREFINKYLTDNLDLILEQQPLTQCAKDGELASYSHNGYWQPMDTYREYKALNDLWESNKAPWKIWE